MIRIKEEPDNYNILCVAGHSHYFCGDIIYLHLGVFLFFIRAGESSQWDVNDWQNFQVLVWICKQCLYQHCQLWDPGPCRSWCENQGSNDWCLFPHCKYAKPRGRPIEAGRLGPKGPLLSAVILQRHKWSRKPNLLPKREINWKPFNFYGCFWFLFAEHL